MVTITIDQDSEFEKTHFKNREELRAYLSRPSGTIPSEFDAELARELDRRDEEMDKEPSAHSSVSEVIDFARTGK